MPLTILLADDSMTAQNMGKKILTEAGYLVVAVSNGAAAVKKIAEHRPDLAVLDVYMPGYTGLEVCERLKNAHETSTLPVLLTVGKMEPFKPEEGTRVRADGLIIKPFEATDLLAAIQKLEEKLLPGAKVVTTSHYAPDPVPEYERTIKIAAPVFDEHDQSYKDWHSAEEQLEEAVPADLSVPTGMQESPAFAEELSAEPMAPQRITENLAPVNTAVADEFHEVSTSDLLKHEDEHEEAPMVGKLLSKAKSWFGGAAVADEESSSNAESQHETPKPLEPVAGSAPEAAGLGSPDGESVRQFESFQSYGAALPFEPAAEVAYATPSMGSFSSENLASTGSTPAAPGFVSSLPAELETFSSSEPQYESSTSSAAAPGFEPTSLQSSEEVAAGGDRDPALVTDVSEMSSAFPTRFGVENAEEVPVGIAANFPSLYADSAPEQTTDAVAEEHSASSAPEHQVADPHSAAPAAHEHASAGEMSTAAAQPAWSAEESHLEEHEKSLMLHEEMHQQFAGGAVAEPEPPVVPAATPEPALAVENGPDEHLAAAMAAAMGSQMAPAITEAVSQNTVGDSTLALDQHTAMIADIVHRVTERMKPDLIAQITREFQIEISKKKQ